MSSVQYYVASSLDGFIATADDDLAWLLQFDGFEGGKESYDAFMAGRRLHRHGRRHLQWLMDHEPGNWPYPATPCWVFTHHEFSAPPGADVTFVRGGVGEFVDDFRRRRRRQERLGGGRRRPRRPVRRRRAAGRADRLDHPGGARATAKRLLPLEGPTPPLELVDSRTQGRGIVELRYRFGAAQPDAAGTRRWPAACRGRSSLLRRCPGSGW